MASKMSIDGDEEEIASEPQTQLDQTPSGEPSRKLKIRLGGRLHKLYKFRLTPSGEPSRNGKFLSYRLMTDRQLEHYYKLHLISDAELEAAGMERSSLIDDYRRLHEKSHEHLRFSNDQAKRLRKLKIRLGIRPHRTYKFQLLNQMVRLMDAVPDPRVIFPEMPLNFDNIYRERMKFCAMAPEKRLRRRFDVFYYYLDRQYVHGESEKAYEVVVDALIRLTKRRLQASRSEEDQLVCCFQNLQLENLTQNSE